MYMETTVKTTKIVILKMTKEEALWLKKLIQNPIGYSKEEEKNPSDMEFRKRFWHSFAKKLSFAGTTIETVESGTLWPKTLT